MLKVSKSLKRALMGGAGASTVAFALAMMPASAVVPNDNQTPEEIIDDEVDVTGVGMFFRNDGFVCTGSLINPRTVLFAAHCVNDRPEGDYGPVIQSAWSFQTDALPGFIDWFGSGFQSNPDLYVYNANQIIYHPDSLTNPQALGFIEADIALSSLDLPAANIPTWAILFSPLPTPETIDPVTGTGYHVDIVGYGGTGTGSLGANLGVDFRRRAAENMLGALASQDDRNNFLFGAGPDFLPQNLYQLDFDDPNAANPFDFNVFRDDALPGEGTTAGGDSGGPLVLDAENNAGYDEDLVLGVLSGGSRFFGPQQFSSYGTTSFYQPLFLYWDWIAANNPYRYVGASAGDGDWEDASHWTSLLDPSYRVLDESGAVVAGLPTNPGAGLGGSTPDFGQVCFDPQPRNDGAPCQDLETGEIIFTGADTGTEGSVDTQSGIGQINLTSFELLANENSPSPTAISVTADGTQMRGSAGSDTRIDLAPDFAEDQAFADGFLDTPNPDPTFENGLPGATGFVPDNINPDIIGGVDARYFDVTLSELGTTTLSSQVEIDRLAVLGGAGLNIAETGDLTSLIDITQMSGTVNVDGALSTRGDYLLMSGLLSGTGTVSTPFLTSVAGSIAPGGIGTVGELTIDGSLVLASGSMVVVDITNGGNDVLRVTGDVSLGGALALNSLVAFGDSFQVLQYDGTSSGEFDTVLGLPDGVLRTELSNVDGAITLDVTAASFTEVLPDTLTETQEDFALALDAARATNFADMQDVFSAVDYLGASDLATAFDNMAPNDAVISGQTLLAGGDVLGQRMDSRLRAVRRGERGFRIAASSQSAETALTDNPTSAVQGVQELDAEANATTHQMRNGYGGFVNIDFYEADAYTGLADQDADLDGFAITGGLDKQLQNGAVLGVTLSYQSSEGETDRDVAEAEVDGGSIGFYGFLPLDHNIFVEGHINYGQLDIDTERNVDLINSVVPVAGSTDADALQFSARVGRTLAFNNGVTFTPSLLARHNGFKIDAYQETGSSAALNVNSRDFSSQQVGASALVEWEMGQSGAFRPSIEATVIQELTEGVDLVTGSFSSVSAGPSISFDGADRTGTWFDLEVGLEIDVADQIVGSIGARQTINRDELSQTILGGSLQVRF